jgi:hypothetical protein
MFIPNSPSPPSGITVSVFVLLLLVLLNEFFSPLPNTKSYHTATRPTPSSIAISPSSIDFSLCLGPPRRGTIHRCPEKSASRLPGFPTPNEHVIPNGVREVRTAAPFRAVCGKIPPRSRTTPELRALGVKSPSLPNPSPQKTNVRSTPTAPPPTSPPLTKTKTYPYAQFPIS